MHPADNSNSLLDMKRPGFLFCICPDPGFLWEYINSQLAGFDNAWRVETFWGDEGEVPEGFWSAVSQPDILGGNRAVVLRNADPLPDAFWKALSRHLSGFKKGIWPIFCLEKPWSKQNKPSVPKAISKHKYWKVARDRKWIWEHPGLTPQTVPGYLKKWAADRGFEFTTEAIRIFADDAPADKLGLDRELEKLELYLDGPKEITPADLTPINSYAELDIFACLMALHEGKTAVVWDKIFAESEKNSDFVFPFIGLLAWETRILWQLRTGQEKEVNLPGFILKQKKSLAGQMNRKHLRALWERILETELRVKSGRLDSTQALEYLVLGIRDIFRPPAKQEQTRR